MWGVPRARVESQSPHDAATCFAVESKKDIPSALGRNFQTPWAYDACTKNPAENWSLRKKSLPSRPGKDSIRRRRLGDGLSGDCLPLKQEQSRPLTWQTNRRQVFCLSQNCERQNCETDERRSAGAALKVRKITWACARARDLPSTPHRLARAAGGDSRVEPTTRARAHRVAAKAGKGWPWTRGELRDTRSSDGPTLRVFLNHEQETGRGRSPRR